MRRIYVTDLSKAFNDSARTPEENIKFVSRNFFDAIGAGKPEVIREIIAKHKDCTEWKNSDGMTGLMLCATMAGRIDIAKDLLNAGAKVDEQNKNESTALMFAAFAGQADMVDLLLSRGSDINHQNINGSTSLMSAAWAGHDAVIKTLVNNGADGAIRDGSGITAQQYAEQKGYPILASFLEMAQEKISAKNILSQNAGEITNKSPAAPASAEDLSEHIHDLAERLRKAKLVK